MTITGGEVHSQTWQLIIKEKHPCGIFLGDRKKLFQNRLEKTTPTLKTSSIGLLNPTTVTNSVSRDVCLKQPYP